MYSKLQFKGLETSHLRSSGVSQQICQMHLRRLFMRLIAIKILHLASRGGRVDSMSAYYTGGLPIESWKPTSVTNVACRERDRPPCCIHTYTVYTHIDGKGRCHTSCDLQDHSMQARKSAGEISTLVLKPVRKDI